MGAYEAPTIFKRLITNATSQAVGWRQTEHCEAVVADMAPSRAVMGRFIGRLIDSLPARVPSAAVSPREYPLERHAAVSYLAYLHEAYDGLPQNGAALALLADVGDAHYLPGRGARLLKSFG